MKYRGNQYEADLKALIKLELKDKKQYQKSFADIMKKYGVSQRTLYRDIVKTRKGKVPGLRKVRKDAGHEKRPATVRDKKMLAELIKSTGNKEKAKEIYEKKTGKKITLHKMTKINKTLPKSADEEESCFGSKALQFIQKLFETDIMAPETGVFVKFNSKRVFMTKSEINDVAMICANAFNRLGKEQIALDRIAMQKNELYYSVQEMHRLAKERNSIKDIEACTRMYTRLDSNKSINLPNDFELYFNAMKKIKPDITEGEAIDLILEQC